MKLGEYLDRESHVDEWDSFMSQEQWDMFVAQSQEFLDDLREYLKTANSK